MDVANLGPGERLTPARGVNICRLDHCDCLAVDVRACREFFHSNLGQRCTERIECDDGTEMGMWLTATNTSCEVTHGREGNGVPGRLHHIALALDSREAILQAADTFVEAGVANENSPHKHAIQQRFFLHVNQPGGNRRELAHSGARLILAADQRTTTWSESERNRGQAWGLKLTDFLCTHATPPLPEKE